MIDSAPSTKYNPFKTMVPSYEKDAIGIKKPLRTDSSYSWSDVPIVLENDVATISHTTILGCNKKLSKLSSFSSSSSSHKVRKSPTNTSRSDRRSKTSKKTVRFAPVPNVRTYSLVLGDHPHCDDGLAIELGWDYSENNFHGKEQSRSGTHSQKNTRGRCQKRPYLTRKHLLLEVAGCTYEELDQRSRDIEATRALNELSRRNQENYYYQLAFPKRRE
eukprot:CAMPEP_0116145270 /NCGR_PEP_ID=MMETSP0329-20121206/16493_1 /TAXON_ID=697910 /ORGANISM="Pseudo-nitzschia arenysensis, Strain B593" /LENGTH=217 /DNA_ID=CAMNT_0003640843 /DNA_START=37 /DNA_END=690 /DNA_ORIENTATION=-